MMKNLKRNWLDVSKLREEIWRISTCALESLKHLHFNGLLLTKVYNVCAKKVQRSYLSWHWRVTQNLKKSWLVIWKMTWWIWQTFTRALKSLKTETLMDSFYSKWKMYDLKIYRGIICHENEKWIKIWRGIALSVQNWHEEFDKSLPKHSKISKIWTFKGLLLTKVYNVSAKKVHRSYVWWQSGFLFTYVLENRCYQSINNSPRKLSS